MLVQLMAVMLLPQQVALPNEVPGLSVPAVVAGDVGDFIQVRATTGAKIVRWIPVDQGLHLFPPEQLKDPNTAVVQALQPGTYRLQAYASLEGVPTLPVYTLVKVGAGPPVPPGPGPGPGPMPPTPTPITSAYVLIIEETADATAQRAIFFTDQNIATWFKSNPAWKWRVVDKDIKDPATGQTPAGFQPWLAKVQGKKLPQVLIIDQDGVVRHQGEMPRTTTDFLNLLKSVQAGGK